MGVIGPGTPAAHAAGAGSRRACIGAAGGSAPTAGELPTVLLRGRFSGWRPAGWRGQIVLAARLPHLGMTTPAATIVTAIRAGRAAPGSLGDTRSAMPALTPLGEAQSYRSWGTWDQGRPAAPGAGGPPGGRRGPRLTTHG